MNLRTSFLIGAVFALSISQSSGVLAQDAPPPPEQDTSSATGVSLVSGGYSTSATDLSIGQGEFPQALTLERQYSSSLSEAGWTTDGLRGWGWATNLHMYITVGELGGGDFPPDEPLPTNQRFPWRYGISVGTGSLASFVEQDPRTDPIIGPNYQGPFGKWDNVTKGQFSRIGDDLVYVGIDGLRHVFEGGSRQTFRDNIPTFRTRLEAPDGTVLHFHGDLGAKSIFSNRGIAILFEFDSRNLVWTKACAVNLSKYFVTPSSNCPSSVPAVSYQHTTLPGLPRRWNDQLTSVTNQLGQTTRYEYTYDKQLRCIKLPGQNDCAVENFYSNCLPIPNEPTSAISSFQQVYRQRLISGATINYSFATQRYCPLKPPGSGTPYSAPYSAYVTITNSDGSTKVVRATYDGLPLSIRDELGRETTMVHGIYNLANRPTKLMQVRAAEGNRWAYQYASNGLVRQTTVYPKSGGGSQVWRTEYGPCAQPTAQIDAMGNRTDIVYSTTHCGILKRTLPADSSGIRAETRYTWGQSYAWIRNASGSYSRAATPVWVLLQEEFCKTSAANNGVCAAGASDKVVTTYEYQNGSSSKGSNVFRVGMAVTADGHTLRTCYRLDEFGRQISETQPKAGLSSCQ